MLRAHSKYQRTPWIGEIGPGAVCGKLPRDTAAFLRVDHHSRRRGNASNHGPSSGTEHEDPEASHGGSGRTTWSHEAESLLMKRPRPDLAFDHIETEARALFASRLRPTSAEHRSDPWSGRGPGGTAQADRAPSTCSVRTPGISQPATQERTGAARGDVLRRRSTQLTDAQIRKLYRPEHQTRTVGRDE